MHRSATIVALALCLSAACAPAPAVPDSAAMLTSARAVDEQFAAAFNKADVDGVMALYWNSPSLVLYPPDAMEVKGYAAVRDSYSNMFVAMKGATIELSDPNYQVAGDTVIGWGRWKLTMPGPLGQPTSIEGRYTDVKAQRDGKWVYIIDHASAPLPAPPPAK